MRPINERPRVVILVKSGLAHSAHVRRSAASLGGAGYDVFVLGGVRDEGEPFDWREENGYTARVVRVPKLSLSGRDAKARKERDDPLNLARYEAAWWPVVEELQLDVVHSFDVSGSGLVGQSR